MDIQFKVFFIYMNYFNYGTFFDRKETSAKKLSELNSAH